MTARGLASAPRWWVRGAYVYTGAPGRPRWVEAMAGQGGRIGWVGDAEGAARWAGPGARVVDLPGAWVVPGFVDCHLHAHGAALEASFCDLGSATCSDEVTARLRHHAATVPSDHGDWLVGQGWSDADWLEPADRHALDEAFPHTPVALRRLDAHAWWANAAALERAGLGLSPADVPGGRVERRVNGDATGVLVDRAAEPLKLALPEPPAGRQAELVRDHLRALAALGVTCVHDMWLTRAGVQAHCDLDAASGAFDWEAPGLPIRVRGYVDGEAQDAAQWFTPSLAQAFGGPRFRVQGFKLFADGALGSRGARLGAPYADAPHTRGLLLHEPAALQDLMERASEAGLQLAVHAIGDEAATVVLDAVERLGALGVSLWRPRIEHAQVISEADTARMAALGVAAALQPNHAHCDWPWVLGRLDAQRCAWAYRAASLLDAGVAVGLSSDHPVADAAPLRTLWASRVRPAGVAPAEELDPATALMAYTTGSAWLAGDEGELGRLAPGLAADFTALDGDPLAEDPEKLLQTRVVYTVCAGRVVHDAR